MKRQQKKPGSIIVWAHPAKNAGDNFTLTVTIKGIAGFSQVLYDKSEPRGGFYAAAKQVAIQRGFTDVIEAGVLSTGKGFIFEPVLDRPKE